MFGGALFSPLSGRDPERATRRRRSTPFVVLGNRSRLPAPQLG